ncbi:ORF223 [White spot syndrome virus]|uniref:ORF223 n=1 Tax=White spot syndrome virus TaxID=342409 RepID=A0A2D3I751_9VIRU|nr:ORF223 [White spot syndrome virus]
MLVDGPLKNASVTEKAIFSQILSLFLPSCISEPNKTLNVLASLIFVPTCKAEKGHMYHSL